MRTDAPTYASASLASEYWASSMKAEAAMAAALLSRCARGSTRGSDGVQLEVSVTASKVLPLEMNISYGEHAQHMRAY